MIEVLAFYWRGDEYDLSSWQGWLKILAGLILWTTVSGMGRSAIDRQQRKGQETGRELPVPDHEGDQGEQL